jgi:hypothetical protein
VVFVASVAAYNTNFPKPPADKTPDNQISETDSPFMREESHPYGQAKFIANLSFEITTVSPVGVLIKAYSLVPKNKP